MKDFGRWLYVDNKGKKNSPVIAIAHNARGFDAHFLVNYLAERGYRPKVTPKGQEIMQLEASMVIVKDSLNILPMSLAALPKAFGFEDQAKKGYFPHYFNTAANEGYEGPLPDHHYYGTATMKDSARRAFFQWHKEQRNAVYVFNLKKEREDYCDNDVFICAKAIMKFRDLVLERTNVDPLRQAMTITSTTSVVYRQNYLPKKTIGLIPPGGYRKNDVQSITAFLWMQHLSVKNNIRIQHAKNGGEKVIQVVDKKYKVDGYAEVDGVKIIYEFHGCRFHGCPKCFKCRSLKLYNQPKTMEERYQNTLTRTRDLESAGYKVIELWGCDLDQMRKEDPDLDYYFRNTEIKMPMDPRIAFFGGRTNATKLFHEFKDGEKGHYVDVCSLYPTTLMYDAFPIGHPIISCENFQRITNVEDHQCSNNCPDCRQSPPCCFNQWIHCRDCNRNFRRQSCYDNHRQ
ncbi:MAG: hypothetical protein GY696_30060, partial [Gammaproteobacteria bacterium]|nr:hypothetical protein [Gammaproteobacteria bacterium]